MKKKLLIGLLTLVMCFISVGCMNRNKELNKLENVSMIIKNKTLTKTGATIIITDLSGNDNTYGESYRIDKNENGKWKELKPIIKDYAWNLVGYTVDENNKLELEHNWEWLYGKLENGKYRLVKDVNNKYISVEFEID